MPTCRRVAWEHCRVVWLKSDQWAVSADRSSTSQEPYSCVQLTRRYFATHTSIYPEHAKDADTVFHGTINCSDSCTRDWSIQNVVGTNLQLLIADLPCDSCEPWDEEVPRGPVEGEYIIYVFAIHYDENNSDSNKDKLKQTSQLLVTNSGALQGAVLSPYLFFAFISDLSVPPPAYIQKYTEDVVLCHSFISFEILFFS
ncbi:unnamed protein product [Echinostoma caproni]|uniref:Uncharacterized protein n=1 Tax=Echinostoma caproni TaxID=27848 RepID=A0A183AUN8_9TREM|nr:unnamed protein product [Echinostoma caproni]